jgi:amino acid transporter
MSGDVDLVSKQTPRVVIATSVMLTFISFWRAAAIVLNDLGSSAYYVGGIAETAIGHAAPWFILGVMLFSYAVRAVYVESCAMFTRGGVYRNVKEALGGRFAKISVSALMFDYILTGPISGVSAGQYIVGLAAQTLTYFGHPWHPPKETINLLAAGIAILIIFYFWRRNIQGIHESSDDALKIMYITTVMVVALIAWCGLTLVLQPDKRRLPPAPTSSNLSFNHDAVGWLPRLIPNALHEVPGETPADSSSGVGQTSPKPHYTIPAAAGTLLGLIGILMAFGHSFLAMSGEESLAQVNRELEYPKHKNLMRAGMVIFVYSLLFTSLVSFFGYAIIPDEIRPQYVDNLISGIAMNLSGPVPLKLLFQAFVVVVGFLMLAGAANTAIIGSNGVLNRVSEDGVLTSWFREPHKRYGTSHRMINMIVVLQILTIAGSRGNVYLLGEAYAFGVVWSFAFNSIAILALRFKDKSPREWKVPLNLPLGGGKEIPLGLGVIALILFTVATANLVTKQVATISGLMITAIFTAIFSVSEHINERKHATKGKAGLDPFRLQPQEEILNETVDVRPGNTLCPVRDYNNLDHVRCALELTHTGDHDLVVMTVKVIKGPNAGYKGMSEQRLFSEYEQLLFSRVVALAEKAGKHVHLLVVPSSDTFGAIAQTAGQLHSSLIIAGRSAVISPDEQARQIGQAWERLVNKPKYQVCFRVIEPNGKMRNFYLGAHAPELSEQDVNRIHELWVEMTSKPGWEHLHHKDVVSIALACLGHDLTDKERNDVLERLRNDLLKADLSESAVQVKHKA